MASLVGSLASVHAAEEVNVYSARKEYLIKPLLDRFTEDTGVTVNLVTAKAGPLLKRLEAEGPNSPADVLITTDAGRLHRAKAMRLLQPVRSPALEAAVPEALRDPDGHWFGLSRRVRPIMYVKSEVDPAELSTYEALAEPKWRGQICIRSSSNIYNQSLVASMIAARGERATREWAQRLVENFARPPQGGDRDQIKAAAAGQCQIAIANNYYLLYMLGSDDDATRETAAKIGIFWPNQQDRGAHVNVSGAGVTRASKHKDNAVRLLEFLLSDGAQRWYADINNEYPVKPGVPLSDRLRQFGEFRGDSVNLARLGELNAPAVKLMDQVGWK